MRVLLNKIITQMSLSVRKLGMAYQSIHQSYCSTRNPLPTPFRMGNSAIGRPKTAVRRLSLSKDCNSDGSYEALRMALDAGTRNRKEAPNSITEAWGCPQRLTSPS